MAIAVDGENSAREVVLFIFVVLWSLISFYLNGCDVEQEYPHICANHVQGIAGYSPPREPWIPGPVWPGEEDNIRSRTRSGRSKLESKVWVSDDRRLYIPVVKKRKVCAHCYMFRLNFSFGCIFGVMVVAFCCRCQLRSTLFRRILRRRKMTTCPPPESVLARCIPHPTASLPSTLHRHFPPYPPSFIHSPPLP